MMTETEELNPAQHEAVHTTSGPVLILAGAGSGKTRVIAYRIAHILGQGTPASKVLALTFTNKAAREMSERVIQILGAQRRSALGKGLVVSTFHSFGLMVLSKEHKAKNSVFTIFDKGDQYALVKELLVQLKWPKALDAGALVERISRIKNAAFSVDDDSQKTVNLFRRRPWLGQANAEEQTVQGGEIKEPNRGDEDEIYKDEYDEAVSLLYPRYQAALRRFHAYDFDDLIAEVARRWMQREEELLRWRNMFRYLLVDEYQDTNGSQMQLLRLLAEEHKNICVVGDDDQSIYAFRGADVQNVLHFERHFSGAKVIKLEQNYRSRKPILDVANSVIAKRQVQVHKKTLFTTKTGGQKVRLAVSETPDSEAKWVSREVSHLLRDKGAKAKEIAVLYRSNLQSKPLEEAFRLDGISYRMVGGQPFYERKEVKDVLSYLKLAIHPSDEISLRRIINYPGRGIGETSLQRLEWHALAKNWSLWQAVCRAQAFDDISERAREGCQELEAVVTELTRMINTEKKPPSQAIRALCNKIDLQAELRSSSGSSATFSRRMTHIEGLISTFARREEKARLAGENLADEAKLSTFLHMLLLSFDDEGEVANQVTLSTLHGVKGLEFEHVFLLGCEEGFLPHHRVLNERATDLPCDTGISPLEEERRLFYVGITRAKEQLTLTQCRHRISRGKKVACVPSRFLADIPEHLLDRCEMKNETPSLDSFADGAQNLLAVLLGQGPSS